MKKYLLSLFAMLAVSLGAFAGDVTDVLDNAWTGISGVNYSAKSGLTATSDAVYSVQCAGGNDAIQLRSNNSNSGIVTTESGGTATTIKVTWNTNTTAGRVLQVYGAIKAYSAPTDLYDATKQGALLGELAYNDRDDNAVTTLDLTTLNGEYTYIGIRSKSGALYLDEVEITWTTGGGPVVAKPTFDPASTSFIGEMVAYINSTVEGGTIYYTDDGATPTVNSEVYTPGEMITIHETTTLKAIVVDANGNASGVAEATYTKLEKSTIADVLAGAVGSYIIEGTIVAAGDAGFIVQDETDYIYYYAGGGNTYLPGAVVQINGTTSEYKGTKQFTSTATVTEVGAEVIVDPDPGVLTGPDFDFAAENSEIEHMYAVFTGKLTISGNYYNIAVEGAENGVGSIIKPMNADDYADLNDKDVTITGYSLYVSGKYVYFIATSIEEVLPTFTITQADGVAGGTLEFEPETAAAGETVTVTVIPDDGNVLESITANCVNINQAVELNVGETPDVYTFEMPADDVVVMPVFAEAPTYTITIMIEGGEGSISVDPEGEAKAGETVTVTVTPEEGYKLASISAYGETTNQVVELNPGPTEGVYTFTMIADNVIVSAVLEEDIDYSGKYYVRNVLANKFWGAGNNWGTQASLVDEQQYVTFEMTPAGTYTMETMVSNGGTSYYFGGEYMDGSAVALTITPQEGSDYVTITNGTNVYGYDGSSTVLARNLTTDAEGALWELLTQEDIDAENAAVLATATQEAPVDATFLIKDPFFSRNRRDANEVWNVTGSGYQLNGGGNGDNNAECYMGTFNIQQTLDAPAGVYKLTAYAAVTYHDNRTIKEWDGVDAPQVFMNEESVDFFEMETADRLTDRATLRRAFDNGKYKIDPLFVQVGDGGNLVVGAYSTRSDIWAVWDTFELTYYGPDADLAEVMLGDLVAELEEQRALAEEYAANPELPAAVVEALNTALSDTETVDPTEEAYKAAIDELKAANETAATMLNAKETLDAMKQLTESTNFYTEEAYEEYYGQWQAKYDAGTLTTEEASGLENPYKGTGWRDAVKVDNFLLSAWDAIPDFGSDYYINTWSTEGNNDGTEFRVPFFEYWTGDGNSLGAKTMTATMTALEPGAYEVTVWARVRYKNGANDAPYGISMNVNDGDAVDVCAGQAVEGTQFYIGEFTAVGVVGEDGVLNFSFDVAGENNVSWLSFQNVVYTPVTYNIFLPDLAGATIFTNPEGEAMPGTTVYITVEPEETFAVETVQVLDYTGAPVAEVEPVETTENVYSFTMPECDVFIDVTLIEVDPNDYTYLIKNPKYLFHSNDGTNAYYDAWTLDPELPKNKERNYDVMNLVTYSGNVNFSITQTIPEVPAGQYRLSVYAFYRPGERADEAARVAQGDPVHNLAMFAEIGDGIYTQNIMNLYEGATETDLSGDNTHPMVAGYEDLFCPSGAAGSRAYYLAGEYRNDLIINVTEDGPVKIGINHPDGRTYDGDYAPIGGWELYRLGDPVLPTEEEYLYVERETGMGYGTNSATVDFAPALEFLGIEDVNEATLVVVNPDGTEIEDYATYDGWFDGDGVATIWGSTTKINVKFFQAIPNGTYTICDMNGADVVGAEYLVKWALKANGKTYQYNITVKFVKPAEYPEVTTIGNLYLASTVEYDYAEGSYVEKTSTLDEEALGAIFDELGVTSLDDVYVYGYNPSDGTFLPFADTRTYDGWRDANGDFHTWTGNSEAPMCVKYSDGTTYYCYNIAGGTGEDADLAAYWAFGNVDGYAVLVEIPFIYSGAPAPTEITFKDLNVLDEQDVEFTFEDGAYQGASADFDVNEVLGTLGIEGIEGLTIYAVLSDGTLDPNYKLGTTDGWRNREGDWQGWGDDAYFCVKTDFDLEYGQITWVGTMDGKTEAHTFVAKFAFVRDNETHDAVVLNVIIYYGDLVGINGIFADKNGETTIFDLSGRRVNTITKGGMYIINGKKVFVK